MRTPHEREHGVLDADGRTFFAVNSLLHASWRGAAPDARRVDARTGRVLQSFDLRPPAGHSFGHSLESGDEIVWDLSPSGRYLALRLWTRAAPISSFSADYVGALLVELRTKHQRVLGVPRDCTPGTETFSGGGPDGDQLRITANRVHYDVQSSSAHSTTLAWGWSPGSVRPAWRWEVPGEWDVMDELGSDDLRGARLLLWGRASYSVDEGPAVCHARTGRLIFNLGSRAGGHSLWSTAASPDGSLLATPGSSDSDTRALLWDTRTGKLVRRLLGHRKPVAQLAFSPDGATLATTSLDGAVKLWRIR